MAPRLSLDELETRPAWTFASPEERRMSDFTEAVAIARLEGYIPTADDERALNLLATGRVTFDEFVELCLLTISEIPISSPERTA